VKGKGCLKINFTAEVLPIGILEPSSSEFFIGEVVGVFEIFESGHESGGQGGSAVVIAVERCEGFIEALPLDDVGELTEWMIEVDLLFELCLKELKVAGLIGSAFLGFHGESNLQCKRAKSLTFEKRHCRL